MAAGTNGTVEGVAHALSLRQPWAALLVHGCKSVEVRHWPTLRRGPVLIHAARMPDPRPEAWALLPQEIYVAAQLRGGIVGVGELTDCIAYARPETFAADEHRHLNRPSWFRQPVYGFVFAYVRCLAFQPCPGSVRFFDVDNRLLAGKRSGRRWREKGWHATGFFDGWESRWPDC